MASLKSLKGGNPKKLKLGDKILAKKNHYQGDCVIYQGDWYVVTYIHKDCDTVWYKLKDAKKYRFFTVSNTFHEKFIEEHFCSQNDTQIRKLKLKKLFG